MNPQTLQEGARILAVVDDLLDDLANIAYLPPYLNGLPPASRHALLAGFPTEEDSKEAQEQLHEHYDLERKLEAAAQGGEMTPADVAELHFSTRALVDTLKAARWIKPGGGAGASGAAAGRLDPNHQPSANLSAFAQVLSIQRGLLHERLTTTVEDDVAKFAILNDTVNREKTASADVQALNREFLNEKESRRVEVEKRDAGIRKLKSERQQVQETFDTEKTFFDKASLEVRQQDTQRYANERDALQHKVEALSEKLLKVQRECTAKELERRQTRTRQETALKQTIDTYDAQMTQVTQDIERLEGENKDTERQLDQVQSELQELNAQQEAFEAEQKLEKDRSEHVKQMRGQLEAHARVIQACFRSHMVRFNMAQKGKKKKKK